MLKRISIVTSALILFMFVMPGLFAQMSDQQVMQEVIKYSGQGMSQEQIFLELSRQGVSAAQLQRIQEQIT
ncbi:MAG: hypothetical protein JG771_859, partial [Methermicoccus sp.]|nr:hypothetical protein [Methermicoccus sp.]